VEIKRLFLALSLSFIFIYTYQSCNPPTVEDETQQLETKEKVLVDQADSLINNSTQTVTINQRNSVKSTLYQLYNQKEKKSSETISTDILKVRPGNGYSSIDQIYLIAPKSESNKLYKYKGAWDREGLEYDPESPVVPVNNACNPCLYLTDNPSPIQFKKISQIKEGATIILVSHSMNLDTNTTPIIKTTTIQNGKYTINHTWENLPSDQKFIVKWEGGVLSSEKNKNDDLAELKIYASQNTKYEDELISGLETNSIKYNNVKWAAIKTKYFMKALSHTNNTQASQVVFTRINNDDDANLNTNIELYYNQIDAGKISIDSYVGPIETQYLQDTNTRHLTPLFEFGWFGFLEKMILWLLQSLYNIIPNYGVVCILFAFIIRLFTGPLTKKSFLSNQKLQALQPKIKKIQNKYKDDQARLSQETMRLYKEEGVNPLGGCLPILIQMPLLIALFQVFRKTIEFRGAEFLPVWITDLSQPDVVIPMPEFVNNIYGLGFFFGHGIALLPIIMGVVMFLSMNLSANTGSEQASAQKFAMYFMNAFFILLFNTFPAGLNLYYTVYNVLNFVQQKKLKRLQPQ